MLAIPGIGPVVAAGWLVSTLAIGAAGAATGGLIGALTGAGVSEDDANVYAEGVRRGGTLVTARVDDNRAAAADEVMRRNNPMDTRKLSSEYRSSGWTGFDQQGGSDRIVAGFETQDRARAARDALTSGGITADRIEMLEKRGDMESWAAMKKHWVPEEDSHLYAECLRRGHSLLIIQPRAGDHDRVLQLIEQFHPIDIEEYATKWRAEGWSGVHPGKQAWDVRRQSSKAEGGREQVIPVYEEQLRVGKRVVERGKVRVRVYTVEQPVQEGVTLRQERVAVERHPVDRPVSGVPGEAFRDRTIEVTERSEEAVVAKEARLKEEVVVRKEADQSTRQVGETVRRTEVEVEDERGKTRGPTTTPKR